MEVDAGLPPLQLRREQAQVLHRERAIRCPPQHILHGTAQQPLPQQRLKRKAPLAASHPAVMPKYPHPSVSAPGPLAYLDPVSLPIPSQTTNPLLFSNPIATITTTIPHYLPSLPPFAKCILAENIIHKYPPTLWTIIYTDGSVDPVRQISGAGAQITTANGQSTLACPLGAYSCSMDAEVRAMSLALRHPSVSEHRRDVVIFTDSLSALHMLQTLLTTSALRPALFHDLIVAMEDLKHQNPQGAIHLQWIPAHVGIPGNEIADKLAKQGSQQPPLSPLSPMKALSGRKLLSWLSTGLRHGNRLQSQTSTTRLAPTPLLQRGIQLTIFPYKVRTPSFSSDLTDIQQLLTNIASSELLTPTVPSVMFPKLKNTCYGSALCIDPSGSRSGQMDPPPCGKCSLERWMISLQQRISFLFCSDNFRHHALFFSSCIFTLSPSFY